MRNVLILVSLPAVFAIALCTSCNSSQAPSSTETKTTNEPSSNNNDQLTQERLRRFDTLDFQFYSNQKWDSFAISHAANIKVYYPDGKVTEGLYPQHIDQLTPMFAFAPDTKINNHPVRFGSGDWTCVIGEMEGTFSKPMAIGGGKTIPPSNKKFKLSMCTVGHWKDGKMIEEYLFWDNQYFMKQIGLAQ